MVCKWYPVHLLYTLCLIAGEIKTIGGGIRVPWTLFLVALELQSWSQSNAKTQYFYLMGRYENKFIRIFMNVDEIIIN